MRSDIRFVAALLFLFCVPSAPSFSADIALISAEAFDNATVQPGGPRSGANGKIFFNVESDAYGSFASYAVADFNFGLQPPIDFVIGATLKLTQSNSSFTQSGFVAIALDTNPIPANIQPGTSPLAFVPSATPPGFGTDADEAQGDLTLDYLYNANTFFDIFLFQEISSGTVDFYSLQFLPWQEEAIRNRINSGGNIRLIIAPADPTVAATWAGFSHSSSAGPTLELFVSQVPEPSSLLLALLACSALTISPRMRSA